jgi:hypothetical protein
MSPRRGSEPRRTDRLVVGRNVTLTLVCAKGGTIKVVACYDGDNIRNRPVKCVESISVMIAM